MRQMVLTLTPDVDENVIIKILENIKGIWKISIKESVEEDEIERADRLIHNLREIRKDIDRSKIDLNDERTIYLMSK